MGKGAYRGKYIWNPDDSKLTNDDIDNDTLIKMYNMGMSVYAINKLTGWPETTCKYRLQRAGVYLYGLVRKNNGDFDIILSASEIRDAKKGIL